MDSENRGYTLQTSFRSIDRRHNWYVGYEWEFQTRKKFPLAELQFQDIVQGIKTKTPNIKDSNMNVTNSQRIP